MELLQKKVRGYISYVRGENPITFPIRLYPEDDFSLKEYPKKDIYGKNYVKGEYQFQFLKMYYNQMNSYQLDIYEKYIQSLNNAPNTSISERRLGIQISNVVYPSIDILSGKDSITKENFMKHYGGGGMFQIMKNKKNLFSYKKEFLTSESFIPFFDLEYIGLISTKIHNLLQGFKKAKPKGIIFIYS